MAWVLTRRLSLLVGFSLLCSIMGFQSHRPFRSSRPMDHRRPQLHPGSPRKAPFHRPVVVLLFGGNEDGDDDRGSSGFRGPDLRFGFGSAGFVFLDALLKGTRRDVIRAGDLIISGGDIPSLGIVMYQSYELQRIYYQGVVDNEVRRLDVDRLDAPPPAELTTASAEGKPEKFLKLYSPQYHSEAAAEGAARRPGPVVVAENELKIVTLAEEVADSAWLALPGLFWVYLCFRFYEYGVATGRM